MKLVFTLRLGRIALGFVLLFGTPFSANGGDGLIIKSGPQRVSSIELYTSEGCGSCPPAEQWLSGLRNDSRLWRVLAPVAFHVDYWDRLGWKDRFAQFAFTARQYAYARNWNRIISLYAGIFR
jgi:hypothetical protein